MFKKIKEMYKVWKFKRELEKVQKGTTIIYIERHICPVVKKKAKKNEKRNKNK